MQMTITKQEMLSDIIEDIHNDNICPELAKTATQLVFGNGNPDADIVLIGEAPGKKEDETGIPFVGASGKFLDEMLSNINLKRTDIYITNIVKYRPPFNRDPLPEEKVAFLPILVRQLNVIQPKVVVTLGRHSMEVFLPGRKIGQIHGQPQQVTLEQNLYIGGDGQHQGSKLPGLAREQDALLLTILPLFHPAAALYNGSLRQTLIDDFAKLPDIINKLEK